MKDTLQCAKDNTMKVKSEDQTSPPGEKGNIATFEKKNNLSEGTMTKDEKKDNQEVSTKGDNLSQELVEKCQIVKKETNNDIDDLTDQVGAIEINENFQEDGKRKSSSSATDLQTRGPNGGIARNGSYEINGYNLYNQPELKSCSNNKRCFRDGQDYEPPKFFKPPVNDVTQFNTFTNHLNGGIVNIKSPSVKTEAYSFEKFDSLETGNFIDEILDKNVVDISCLAEETSPNNLYLKSGPPSNQSDSGVSGMSAYSPYQDIHSPDPSNRSSSSPPHMPEHVFSPQPPVMNIPQVTDTFKEQNGADPIAGREEELQAVLDMIGDDLLKDKQKKRNKGMTQHEVQSISMPNNPIKNESPVITQMNTFNSPQHQTPPPPIYTMPMQQRFPDQRTIPQQPQVFGTQNQNSIILPPGVTQPGCIPQNQAIVRPIMGGPIPIGTITPYTQPQIIIIQQTPTQAPNKKMPRPIAPKTDKQPPIKKAGPQQQAEPIQKRTPPVLQVQPTPAPIPTSVPQQQRPVNNQQGQQNNTKKLNMARRMVAAIPSDHLKTQDEEGDTYLHVAACKNDPNMIQALLERLEREGLDWLIDLENKKRMTPLYLAVLNNQPEMVEIFLKFNAEPNALAQSASSPMEGKSKEVKAPIHVAAAGGDEYVQTLMKLLAHKDISLNIYNSEGHTALHSAIISHGTKRPSGSYINSLNAIQALIKAGADPNSQDKKSGKTPLMYAIEKRDCMLIERMLRLFDPKKLRNVVKSQTFDGSNCLRIAEGRKSEFNPQEWQKLWDLLNKACTGELPRSMPVY